MAPDVQVCPYVGIGGDQEMQQLDFQGKVTESGKINKILARLPDELSSEESVFS